MLEIVLKQRFEKMNPQSLLTVKAFLHFAYGRDQSADHQNLCHGEVQSLCDGLDISESDRAVWIENMTEELSLLPEKDLNEQVTVDSPFAYLIGSRRFLTSE